MHTTGLRYFTVYGPWGQPDMAMFIFTKNILAARRIPVFNNGKMKRNFTYINDIISGTQATIDKNYECEVFNLGNNNGVDLMDLIELIENEVDKKAIIDLLPMQPGDVKETSADLDHSIEKLSFSPKTSIEIGISKFFHWYKADHK